MTDRSLFLAVVVGGLLFITGQYVASQPQRIQQEVEANREISVSGIGEVSATPDVALITLGVNTGPQATAQQALELLSERFDRVLSSVQGHGVDDADITTTDLSLSPRYDFNNGEQRLVGFEASESIRIKVRDLSAVGQILSAATVEGVNQAGGISFEIDDPRELRLQAQEEAIRLAKENAERLVDSLDARLGEVKNFHAQTSDGPQPLPLLGRGGAEMAADAVPPVNPGTQKITSTVTITYSLR